MTRCQVHVVVDLNSQYGDIVTYAYQYSDIASDSEIAEQVSISPLGRILTGRHTSLGGT